MPQTKPTLWLLLLLLSVFSFLMVLKLVVSFMPKVSSSIEMMNFNGPEFKW